MTTYVRRLDDSIVSYENLMFGLTHVMQSFKQAQPAISAEPVVDHSSPVLDGLGLPKSLQTVSLIKPKGYRF